MIMDENYKRIVLPYWVVTNRQPNELTAENVKIILAANLRMSTNLSIRKYRMNNAKSFSDVFNAIIDFMVTSECIPTNSFRYQIVYNQISRFITINIHHITNTFSTSKSNILKYINRVPLIYVNYRGIVEFTNSCTLITSHNDFSDDDSLKIILNKLNGWYEHEPEYSITESILYKHLLEIYPNSNIQRIINRYKLTEKF